jgi:hypothetical protein
MPQKSCQSCKSDWKPSINSCFKYYNEELSWQEARLSCTKKVYNSSLAIIENSKKLAQFQKALELNSSKQSLKIWVRKPFIKFFQILKKSKKFSFLKHLFIFIYANIFVFFNFKN